MDLERGTLGIDDLGTLLRFLRSTDVEELELEHLGTRILIRRDPAAGPPDPRTAPAVDLVASEPFIVTAPMVGVFRGSAGASEPPLQVGGSVSAGQVVGGVEAMRMLNRVQSERAGIVDRLLVQDGQPVEYGQGLLVLRAPDDGSGAVGHDGEESPPLP